MTTEAAEFKSWIRESLLKLYGSDEPGHRNAAQRLEQTIHKESVAEKPTRPCPVCGSNLFYLSRSRQDWLCMSHQTPASDNDVNETFNLYGLRAGQTPKSLVQKGAIMDFDIKRLVNAIAKQTGLTRSEVERAMSVTVNELKAAAATKSEAEVAKAVAKVQDPGMALKPFESQHRSVTAVKNMTGATTRRQRTASNRDAFGRQMKNNRDDAPRRGMYGERLD